MTQQLAASFGVSHTPIREALIELASMGVIDLLPNRGAVVRKVTTKEVREVCHVRRALEVEATRTACGRIDLTKLNSLADEIRRLMQTPPASITQYIRTARNVDTHLHDLIASSCDNVFLANELSRLKILFRVFRDVSWELEESRNDSQRVAQEAVEHLAIVEALLAGDSREAARAMARHIRSGAWYWSRTISVPKIDPQVTSPNSEPTRKSRKS